MIEQILSRLSAVPDDKVRHFAVAVILYAAVQWWNALAALAVVAVVAVVKEIYDRMHKDIHTCDVWDAIATILGGVAGFLISVPHLK